LRLLSPPEPCGERFTEEPRGAGAYLVADRDIGALEVHSWQADHPDYLQSAVDFRAIEIGPDTDAPIRKDADASQVKASHRQGDFAIGYRRGFAIGRRGGFTRLGVKWGWLRWQIALRLWLRLFGSPLLMARSLMTVL
jgi:hypothetical protein